MAIRTNTNSIIRALGLVTRNNVEMVNIFKKINIKQSIFKDINIYEEYIVEESDRWDIISDKFYDTTSLYWLLATFNNIKDPFSELIVGESLQIIKPSFIPSILIELQK